jgi:excisionase family DNA binding protein
MDDFLTTRQTQDLLKVDRITIYRMLNDGRLKGTKIGQQWRFPRLEVERLLNGSSLTDAAVDGNLPVHCLQTIQDLFATISQLSAVLIYPEGNFITSISNPCSFCRMSISGQTTLEDCRSSQAQFIGQARDGEKRFTCHTGLHYAGRLVSLGPETIALFIVGGYRRAGSSDGFEPSNIQELQKKGFLENEIIKAYEETPVLPLEQESRLDTWADAAAEAFESILQERSAFSHRLKKIADLTQIP